MSHEYYEYYGEKIRKYSFKERFNYTRKRKWFCKRKFLFCSIPYIASDFDIYVDYIWRDFQVKKIKKEKINANTT